MSRSRHNEAADRLAAALAERHPAGWDLPGQEPDPAESVPRATPAGAAGRHARGDDPARPSWLRAPAGVAGARLAPVRPAVVALLALVIGLAAVFGVRLVRAQELGEPVAPGRAGTTQAGPGSTGSAGPDEPGANPDSSGSPSPGPRSASGESATGAAEVVVHVVGQVRHPGVVDLPSGSRVVDAIKRAGGARTGADLAAVNLARPVVDGEQIMVPKPGQRVAAPPATSPPGSANGAGSAGGGAAVNINTADLAGLDTLPGVGPVLAGRILAWRDEHGRFTSIDELGEVSGIGEKLLAQLRPLVTV